MNIHVMGSVAFDRIMTYKGNFEDLLLPDKLHMLSVVFLIDRIEEKRGGTAGNVAYNLAMLEEQAHIYCSVGHDFRGSYEKALQNMKVNLDGIRILEEQLTACAYITADQKGNQITGFSPAAMNTPADPSAFSHIKTGDIGIVSPGNAEDMGRFPQIFKEKNVPYIYDPGQQIPAVSRESHLASIEGAQALIGNDYEIALICERTGCTKADLMDKAKYVITTLGEGGCLISQKGRDDILVPAPKISMLAEPTGAGDSLRAGMLKGLTKGFDMETCVKLGSICAAYCVEKYGTQEHYYTLESFRERYRENYGPCPL